MKLHLYSRFNQTGIGRHGEAFSRAIQPFAAGKFDVIYVNIDEKMEIAKMVAERTPEDIMISFVMLTMEFLPLIKGKRIYWFPFESTRISSKWKTILSSYDEIWTPSAWGRDVLINSGVAASMISVAPEGVDAQKYRPNPLLHDGFIFLSIGKYEKRKGINELIHAFLNEFPRAQYPDAKLWLKADFPMLPPLTDALRSSVAFDDRITVIGGEKTDDEIIALYNQADAFVFPSRAEGFGLPCIEALACGVPVVALNYSGQMEYLQHVEGLYIPIAHEMEDIEDIFFDHFYKDIYAGEPYGQWAKPDIPSIQKGMRQRFGNRAVWSEKALKASDIIRAKFDWSQSAKRAMELFGY